jgi:ATP-binding cassette subfamily B protein
MSRSVERNSNNVVRDVLAFLMRHWQREAWCVAGIAVSMTVATSADLLLPEFSGRLVDAVARGGARLTALHLIPLGGVF